MNEQIQKPRQKFLSGLICSILSFCFTMLCFGLTATLISIIYTSFNNDSFGLLTFLSIISADAIVSLCVACCMGIWGAHVSQQYNTRQMMIPIAVVAVCFCGIYCIGETNS